MVFGAGGWRESELPVKNGEWRRENSRYPENRRSAAGEKKLGLIMDDFFRCFYFWIWV